MIGMPSLDQFLITAFALVLKHVAVARSLFVFPAKSLT